MALISVKNLRTWYPIRKGVLQRVVGHVRAVDGVSFDIPEGKTLALVGESGCGKTTTGKSILRLVKATEGRVEYKSRDLLQLTEAELRPLRRDLQIIFQDPYSSLNPRLTVGQTIMEGMAIHRLGDSASEREERTVKLLKRVGLNEDSLRRYPHEFSGGQRQRVGIARALAVEPKFIVCDEPISALDVSIQAQILNLMKDLQEEFRLTYLFITHDLGVVEYIADEVAVMYLGRIVEQAPCEELFDQPMHPYTQALLSSIPVPDPKSRDQRIVLRGDVPSPIDPPSGCHFHPRCSLAEKECSSTEQSLNEIRSGHLARCMVVQRDSVAVRE
ncbi:MAG: ABC transporter ATP-binding protein [Planctomycetota bacterium]|nr:ABC transporter ATP-binding protein [Planctomycetota bacterium]MDA1137828.1 ABC transporter ATP-binding protein [Planctomycetota bacterium]